LRAAPAGGRRGDAMWWRALLVGGFLAGLLSACAVVDPVDNRYDNISRSWAKARNESIFLNLVRASHDYPLSFTTVSNVTPSMTNVTSLGLPSFLEGPGFIGLLKGTTVATSTFPTSSPGRDVFFGNTTANNNTTVSTNFSVSTQETSAFYQGFLKPIDLQTLNYFIRQGYSRELLFWLFADSFEIQRGSSPVNSIGYEYSPPDSYGCPRSDPYHRCFREWVWIALLTGLTVEEQSILKESRGSTGSAGGTSKPETIVVARFCFSPELASQARNQMPPALVAEIKAKYMRSFANPSPICGTWTPKDAEDFSKLPQPDTFNFKVGSDTFRVVSRSAYGVFEFLGNLMKMQREGTEPTPGKAFLWPPGVGEPNETEIPPVLQTIDNAPPLITVVQTSGAECFAHTWFYDGDYCVPEDASTTKKIFSLLAQLIAIQTAASDLSITPVVRVIQ
jgi:hypothetical protein